MSSTLTAAAAVPRKARELLRPEVAGSLSTVGKVLRSLEDTAKKCGQASPPRLVAVSKTHPVDKVQWAYQQGLRHFGENYAQELQEKSQYLQNCGEEYSDVKWHYIGHVQKNKIKSLINSPGLWMVETLHKVPTAVSLNRAWGLRASGKECSRLKVLIQVNTSREEGKLGCLPEALQELVQCVLEDCPHLEFSGLMTIGRLGHQHREHGPNPDYNTLAVCAKTTTSTFDLCQPMELSMGMSADYEHAIEMGSTSVRVGTAIFGHRN